MARTARPGVLIRDEGGDLGTATTLDFVGAGVTASDQGNGVMRVTITGGGSGSGTNAASQIVTVVQSGSNVTIDLTQLSNSYLTVVNVFRNGQNLTPNGNAGLPGSSWSKSVNTVTVYNGDPSDIYIVEYTY